MNNERQSIPFDLNETDRGSETSRQVFSCGVEDAPNQPPTNPVNVSHDSFVDSVIERFDARLVTDSLSNCCVGTRGARPRNNRLEQWTHYDRLRDSYRPDSPHWVITVRDFGHGLFEAVVLKDTDCKPRPRNKGKKRKPRQRKQLCAESIERCNRRARRDLRHKILMMEADRLLTLTFRENVTDLNYAGKCFRRWLRMVQRVMPDLQYVAVMEFQSRGAIHWHLAIRGFRNVNVLRHYWWKVVGKGMGNIDITNPRRGSGQWRRRKLAAYLAKYMAKGVEHQATYSKRFRSSRDIAKPDRKTYYMPLGDSPARIVSNVLWWASGGKYCKTVLDFSDGGKIMYWGST